MTVVMEIEGLVKTYRRAGRARRALDGFDMTVRAGEIHGFLGPNGSGKTTTLRTLLGLVRPNSGAMRLFGRPVPDALPEVIGRVGAIVESPRFFANFSGRRTLRLLARTGGIPRRRCDEVLELVGLADRADDRVKGYSLGMRQRLAVASALLKSPDLLILDEPANGLDPAGIREMRSLMRDLVAGGATVVLSSHILGEVQQICDSVTIISRGRRVAAGPVAEVLASQGAGELRVRVAGPDTASDAARPDADASRTDTGKAGVDKAGADKAGVDKAGADKAGVDKAAAVLTGAGATVRRVDDHLMVSGAPDPAWVTRTLAQRELWVSELTPAGPDLEAVFLRLTGEPAAPEGPASGTGGGAVPSGPPPGTARVPAPAPSVAAGAGVAATTDREGTA